VRLLLLAAGIEAFWSGSAIPSIVKHAVGVTLFILVWGYLLFGGRGARQVAR